MLLSLGVYGFLNLGYAIGFLIRLINLGRLDLKAWQPLGG